MDEDPDRTHSPAPGDSQSMLCKRCYLRYGDKKGPLCEHVFCIECFDKSVDAVTDDFVCCACKQEMQTETPVQGIDDIFEVLSDGVRNIRSIRCNRFVKPWRLAATRTGNLVVVDIATSEILIFGSDGKMKNHFPYLVNYCFTEGLLVTPNDDILLTLRNDKHNSVCFYSTDGTFKFSSFLSQSADATGLARNKSTKEILALDNKNGEICIIDTEKSVHRKIRLKESRREDAPNAAALTSISVGTRGDIFIYDSANKSVHVYDERYDFKYKFDANMFCTPRNSDTGEQIEDNAPNESCERQMPRISVDRNNCIFATNVKGSSVVVYSLSGEFVDMFAIFKGRFESAGTVQDLVCFGGDKLAVLLTGGSAKRGEIRVYSYTLIPRRFRNRACCTLS